MQSTPLNFTVEKIAKTGFEKVPRATLINKNCKMIFDYQADLCVLKEGDTVDAGIYTARIPSVGQNTYLMRGVIYKVGEKTFEASFGGLLLFYEGQPLEQIGLESEIYLSVGKGQ